MFSQLIRQRCKTSSDFAKMTLSRVLHLRKEKTQTANEEMALIPRCWLTTIVSQDIWPILGPFLRWNSHLSNLYISAELNVERSGHLLDDEERRYLRLILSWVSGWSSTAVEHMNDPEFCYIRHRYRQIKNLAPILDNETYPEEAAWMPRSIPLGLGTHVLLASSDRFYLYLVEFDELLDAGSTLKGVYEGLKPVRWYGPMEDCPFEHVEPFKERWIEHISHFADYDDFTRKLLYEVVPFVAPLEEADCTQQKHCSDF